MSPRPSDPLTRVKLLAAAEAEFVARGLERAKVEQITARAGVSKGSFYLHFDSKEDAFRELVENMLARLASFLDGCPVDCAEEELPAIVDFWVNYDVQIFEFIWQNRGLCSLLLGGGASASYRHLVDEIADRGAVKTRLMLERGIERGLYRANLDIDVAATFISGAFDRLARRLVKMDRKPDLVTLLRKVQLLVLGGVAGPKLAASLADGPRVHEQAPPAANGVHTPSPRTGGQVAIAPPPLGGRATKPRHRRRAR